VLGKLEAGSNGIIIPKKRYSAFHGTNLENILREREVKDLVIGGVMTNLCCETTARDAFVRDFRVFFLADGTSTVSEDYHLAALKNLAYGFATILTCNQFIQSVQNW
jgi:isochorismate hydrolase